MYKRKLMKGASDTRRATLEKTTHELDEMIKQEHLKKNHLELKMKFLHK